MKFLLLSALIVISQLSFAQNHKLSKELVDHIEKRVELGLNASVAICVVDEKGTTFHSFGNKTMDGEKINEHSVFEIGSISKVFTTTILAKFIKAGKIKLSDPVSSFFPNENFDLSYDNRQITIGHLADHTSSLPRMPNNFNPSNPANPFSDYDEKLLYEFLSEINLSREIGSQFEYSNLAVGLLGFILAEIDQTTYDQLLQKHILDPLKMNETMTVLNSSSKENLAVGYNGVHEVANWDLAILTGAGGIKSTTADMAKFMSLHLGLETNKLSSAAKLTHKKRHDKVNSRTSIGLGWFLMSIGGKQIIAHDGATGGYKSSMALDVAGKKGGTYTNELKRKSRSYYRIFNGRLRIASID